MHLSGPITIIPSMRKPLEVERSGLSGGEHDEARYNGVWRQITGLAQGASQTVRCDAGVLSEEQPAAYFH